jgi:hypothetical protein
MDARFAGYAQLPQNRVDRFRLNHSRSSRVVGPRRVLHNFDEQRFAVGQRSMDRSSLSIIEFEFHIAVPVQGSIGSIGKIS